MENQKPEAAELARPIRKDNQNQFGQRRILEKIGKISKPQSTPKITCFECDETMSIVGQNEEASIAKCTVCNHSTLIQW